MIKIVFFASLREQLGCSEIMLPADDASTVNELKAAIIEHDTKWKKHFENTSLLSAVNHIMVDDEHPIRPGDEVAFFPPVTGG